eukprot:2842418-Pleurochrysis_carterae.AAC.2
MCWVITINRRPCVGVRKGGLQEKGSCRGQPGFGMMLGKERLATLHIAAHNLASAEYRQMRFFFQQSTSIVSSTGLRNFSMVIVICISATNCRSLNLLQRPHLSKNVSGNYISFNPMAAAELAAEFQYTSLTKRDKNNKQVNDKLCLLRRAHLSNAFEMNYQHMPQVNPPFDRQKCCQ